MSVGSPTVHASAVLVGARALLIRGPAGSGKSHLALKLIEAGETGLLTFARLVGDDRVHLEAHNGRLVARPADKLAGLIEVRGLGVRRVPYEPAAVVGLVIDLSAKDGERVPQTAALTTTVEGVTLARLAVAAIVDPLPLIWARLMTRETHP